MNPTGRAAWKRVLRYAAIVLGVAVLLMLGRKAGAHLPALVAGIQDMGIWAPVAFVALYAVATVAFIPGSLLTLLAGAVFGLARGTLYVFVGAVAGSIGAFLVSRYLARRVIETKLAGNARFTSIDRAVGENGLRIVALLRLTPVIPFNLLNYALGLTRVRLADYALASFAMLPGTFLYVYYGKVAGDVAAIAGGVEVPHGPEYWITLGVGLAATIAVTVIVTRIARKALAEAVEER